ncbi:(d)CMP kinase [Aureisphaera galaxeae]|uniref:(d)CMP kinase n=1 Tax=Aureisphaera galaxeae TaxID=1538023 RepID=UPI00234FDAE0|nr:(d)CMP kinase [Aureisphaera galaxeae]MDC8004064.1 (d)CMP kinase [Aureisphaera galaxeae]
MRNITIAIDGHSSTGKSTVAKQLADYIGYIYVDTGAMYRAVTLFALQHDCIAEEQVNEAKLVALLPEITLHFEKNEDGKAEVFLNGKNVEKQIRTLEVSEYVSPVATISEVRRKLVEQQRAMRDGQGIVMDGRDIGTVVFPNAEFKVFMTASAEVRAQRRYEELMGRGHTDITFEEVLENVTERDHIDSTREDSPLVKAGDAIVIDNSEMNLEDQFHILLQLAKDRIAGRI